MNTVPPELEKLTRNPAITIIDRRETVAGKFKDHKSTADEVAATLRAGELFTLVQASPKGFWVSEWTVNGYGEAREAVRRRAGDGKTLEAAIDAMTAHSSHHNSHYYRPEENILKMLRRVYFPRKVKA